MLKIKLYFTNHCLKKYISGIVTLRNIQPWLGGSVGWCVIPNMETLQVQSPVRAHSPVLVLSRLEQEEWERDGDWEKKDEDSLDLGW